MASARWMRPEDFLRRWRRGTPFPEERRPHEAVVAAVVRLGMSHVTGERWLLRTRADKPSGLLAARSLCHAAYADEPLRLPIEIVSIPDTTTAPMSREEGQRPDAMEAGVAAHLLARLHKVRRRAAGSALFVQLPSAGLDCHAETLARLIGASTHGLSQAWLLGAGGRARYCVVQVHPSQTQTVVDLDRLDHTDVVV